MVAQISSSKVPLSNLIDSCKLMPRKPLTHPFLSEEESTDSFGFSFVLCYTLESPPHDYSFQVYLDLLSLLKSFIDLELVFLASKVQWLKW